MHTYLEGNPTDFKLQLHERSNTCLFILTNSFCFYIFRKFLAGLNRGRKSHNAYDTELQKKKNITFLKWKEKKIASYISSF